MKKLKLILLAILLCTIYSVTAQVAINGDGSDPDGSAILDVKSNEKGLLIPRMIESQRTGITTPATGLLVYQTDGNLGFYYNAGTPATPNWIQLSSTLITQLADADGDTKVQVEETADEDKIRFDVAGSETMVLDGSGILSVGTYGSGTDLTVSGEGTRMIWYPKKAAFRAGTVDGDQWNLSNIGDCSTAMGKNTTASEWASTAMGYHTTASESASTAMGYSTTASGESTTAMGNSTTASGWASTAMGHCTTASGGASTTMGHCTTASNWASTAIGRKTTASGEMSTAIGYYTTVEAYTSLAIGMYNVGGGTSNSWVATDPLFEIGNGTDEDNKANALTVLKNGNVGIGTSTPASILDIAGEYHFPSTDGSNGQVLTTNGSGVLSWTSPSVDKSSVGSAPYDRRLKKDIQALNTENNLSKILQLEGVRFKWKENYNDNLNLGFIAKDVKPVIPESVRYDTLNDIYSMEYSAIIPVLVEAIKEQQLIITELKTRIEQLEK